MGSSRSINRKRVFLLLLQCCCCNLYQTIAKYRTFNSYFHINKIKNSFLLYGKVLNPLPKNRRDTAIIRTANLPKTKKFEEFCFIIPLILLSCSTTYFVHAFASLCINMLLIPMECRFDMLLH